jgi:MFS family permease
MGRIVAITVASSSFFFSYYSRLAWSVLSIYMPFQPTVVQQGLVFSLFFVGYVIVQIPAGMISDRFSGGIVIAFALIGLAGSTLFSGIAVDIVEEYVASFLMGLTAGWIYPASINVMRTYFRNDFNVYIGYYSLAWPLAIVAVGFVLPWVAINIGWEWGYYTAAIGCIIVSILSFSLKTDLGKARINFLLFGDRRLLFLSLGGFLFFLSYWSITLFSYRYFISLGISPGISGLIFSCMAIGGLFSTLAFGYIVRYLGLKRTTVLSLIIYALFVSSFSWLYSAVILVLIALLTGFFRFIVTPSNSSLAAFIGGQNAAGASGISNMFWQLSGFVGPLLSAFIINIVGMRELWIYMGVIIIAGTLFYMLIKFEPVSRTEAVE